MRRMPRRKKRVKGIKQGMKRKGKGKRVLYFATSNRNKFREVRWMLGHSVQLKQARLQLDEPQLWDIREVAASKARQAYRKLKKPVFVEDTALYINALHRFPGAFISWIEKTIGNRGLLKLLEDATIRHSQARAVLVYCDGRELKTFVGDVKGTIAKRARGGGWGFDPIFIPIGYSKTYGELGERKKNKISHRRKVVEKFKKWLKA